MAMHMCLCPYFRSRDRRITADSCFALDSKDEGIVIEQNITHLSLAF